MPKYSQIKWKDLIKLLEKNWFKQHSWSWSHCTLKNATTWKRTTIPVHNKPIWKWLLSAILKQAGLHKDILDS